MVLARHARNMSSLCSGSDVCLSVCLSVLLSVTLVDCEHIVQQKKWKWAHDGIGRSVSWLLAHKAEPDRNIP